MKNGLDKEMTRFSGRISDSEHHRRSDGGKIGDILGLFSDGKDQLRRLSEDDVEKGLGYGWGNLQRCLSTTASGILKGSWPEYAKDQYRENNPSPEQTDSGIIQGRRNISKHDLKYQKRSTGYLSHLLFYETCIWIVISIKLLQCPDLLTTLFIGFGFIFSKDMYCLKHCPYSR